MSKSVLVETDAPDRSTFRLFLTANIVVPIEATPRLALRLVGVEGDPLSDRILLHRRDGQALELSGLRVEGLQGIEVRTHRVKESGTESHTNVIEGDLWVEAYVPDGQVDSHLMSGSGTVRARTNHHRIQVLEIPLAVGIRRLVESRPSRLWLQWSEETDAAPVGHVIVAHSRGEPLVIERIEVLPENLVVATTSPTGRPSSLRLNIALASDAASIRAQERTNGVVRVHLAPGSDAKELEPLDIPVTIGLPPQSNEPPPERGGS